MVAIAAMAVFLSAALLGLGIACCGCADDVADRGDGWGNVEREIRVFSWQKLCGRDKMESLGCLGLFIDDDRCIRVIGNGKRTPSLSMMIGVSEPAATEHGRFSAHLFRGGDLKTCPERFFHGWLCRRW